MTAGLLVWALVNSVWQTAAIFAAVAALSRIVKLSAAQSHALWFSALVAASVLPIADLALPASRAIPVRIPTYASAPASAVSGPSRAALPPRPVQTQTARSATAPAASTNLKTVSKPRDPAVFALLLWALAAFCLTLRLAYGYIRLKVAKLALVPDGSLTVRAAELGTTRRKVRVGISRTLGEPCVIGFYRPCVAVPAALAASLTQTDLDRILRHECAHIARYDDYTNLFRQAVRAALFFNPFVHAIARSMALEAEIACDDAAAPADRERVAFAKCLYELARTARRRYSPAAGFFGSRRQIGLRVTRLLERNHASSARLSFALKGAAALVVLSSVALGCLRVTALAAVRQDVPPKIAGIGFSSRDVATAAAPALAVARDASFAAQPIAAATPSNLTAPVIFREDVHVHAHARVRQQERTEPVIARVTSDIARVEVTHNEIAQTGSGDLIDALAAAGYRGLSPDDLIELNNHGVSADLINALHSRGVGPLPVRTLVALADHGVSVDFIAAVRDAGYTETDPDMLVRLADHGVSADYIREVNAATGGRIRLEDFASMADAGVSADLVRQLAELGYRGISARDYVRMANAGVTPQLVKRIMNAHLTDGRLPTVEQLIELANAGV